MAGAGIVATTGRPKEAASHGPPKRRQGDPGLLASLLHALGQSSFSPEPLLFIYKMRGVT